MNEYEKRIEMLVEEIREKGEAIDFEKRQASILRMKLDSSREVIKILERIIINIAVENKQEKSKNSLQSDKRF